MSQNTQPCPNCQTVLPVHTEYVTWCHECGWNLQPAGAPEPRNLFETFYLALGARSSQALFEAVSSGDPGTPVARIAALGLAGLVHLTTLGFVALGVTLIVTQWAYIMLVILGLLCLLLAWMLLPRLGKRPQYTAPPDKFPMLYAVAGRVAQSMGVQPPAAMLVDARFNASYQEFGLRRQSAITLGLPLMAILTPEERVAILAHEVAHGANHDPTRSLVVWSAIVTLQQWYLLLQPRRSPYRAMRGRSLGGAISTLSDMVTGLLARIVSAIPWAGQYLLSHLVWQDSQRAEYLADLLSVRAAGTGPVLAALRKLHYTDAFRLAQQRIAVTDGPDGFFTLLSRNVSKMPAREVERIERVEMMQGSRLDATHPPTAFRIRHIEAHLVAAPAVTLSAAEAAALDRELMAFSQSVERALRDSYRSALYGMGRPARR